MVYDEYKDFMNYIQVKGEGFGMKLYKRPVALKVKKKGHFYKKGDCHIEISYLSLGF